jgi:hypothetical protein
MKSAWQADLLSELFWGTPHFPQNSATSAFIILQFLGKACIMLNRHYWQRRSGHAATEHHYRRLAQDIASHDGERCRRGGRSVCRVWSDRGALALA